MKFFEQQDIARRNTKRLVLLLALAVLSLILITTLLFAFLMYFLQTGNKAPRLTLGSWFLRRRRLSSYALFSLYGVGRMQTARSGCSSTNRILGSNVSTENCLTSIPSWQTRNGN
jgi:hypothetical protein